MEKDNTIQIDNTIQDKKYLTNEDFLPYVSKYTHNILLQCKIIREKSPEKKVCNRRFLGLLIANSRILEDFLDDHGAKHNIEWFYFRELIATARGFSQTGYLMATLRERYSSLATESTEFKTFFLKANEVESSLIRSILYILNRIETQSKTLEIKSPKSTVSFSDCIDPLSSKSLPVTIIRENSIDDGKDIAKICSLYQNFDEDFESLGCFSEHFGYKRLKQIVPEVINEECIRKFELLMHNLESVYDTYVNARFSEDKDPRLSHLRNFISIPLLLLEIARAWSHFYERHQAIHEELHTNLPDESLLENIINWALFFCRQFVSTGKSLAENIQDDYTSKGSVELGIPKNMGFHLRPATLVSKIVNHYGSEVYMIVGDDKFEANSPICIVWAGGKIARDNIEKVTFVGDKRALRDIEVLASVNYGEDLMGKDQPLPKEISYLRKP